MPVILSFMLWAWSYVQAPSSINTLLHHITFLPVTLSFMLWASSCVQAPSSILFYTTSPFCLSLSASCPGPQVTCRPHHQYSFTSSQLSASEHTLNTCHLYACHSQLHALGLELCAGPIINKYSFTSHHLSACRSQLHALGLELCAGPIINKYSFTSASPFCLSFSASSCCCFSLRCRSSFLCRASSRRRSRSNAFLSCSAESRFSLLALQGAKRSN